MATHAQARLLMLLQQRLKGRHLSYQEAKSLEPQKVQAWITLLRAGINPTSPAKKSS